MYCKILLLLSLLVCSCFSLNILVVYPHTGKSHFLAFQRLFTALAERGHNLTVISHFPKKNPIPNYRDVNLQSPSLDVGVVSLEKMPSTRIGRYACPLTIASFAATDCPKGLQNSNFIKFLEEDNNFDLIIAEVFNTNCFMGLVNKYQAPVIGLSSSIIMPWAADWIGNPYHPAYIPNIFMDYSDHLSFLERVENTLMFFYSRLVFKYTMEIPGNELSKKYLGEDLLTNGNVMYNLSLLLTNSHFSLNLPRPLVPANVEVAGIHIGPSAPLPSNLEKWINESSDGIIFFSLGSLIKGHTFPKDKINAFFKAFKRLPQRVLWKWENETMEEKPDNVMIQKWMPQTDVLCHPNVKVFISHGGLLGVIEAVHCGIPVVVMPQLGDQYTNARALETVGGGVMLELKHATEDTVYEALKTVLSDDFKQKTKKLSERFRDRPLPPLETAIYWVEYVAKHKGAGHMRTAAVDMPFYQYYLIDVAAFLLFAIIAFIYTSYRVTRSVIIVLFKTNVKKLKSS